VVKHKRNLIDFHQFIFQYTLWQEEYIFWMDK